MIPIPGDVYEQKEVELADQFSVEYEGPNGIDSFNGRYYIIILNKGETLIEVEEHNKSVEEVAHSKIQ